MKTKILVGLALALLASICFADLATPPSMQHELRDTEARIKTLQTQVRSLEMSVAKLQRQMDSLQQPKVVPVQVK